MTDLPPLDQPQAYVVVGPNDQRGPYTLELLIGEVLAGRLHDATPVWWPGLAEWTTMNSHPGVAAELARRRGGYADPQQAYAPQPAAPAPEPAPAPGQYEQYDQGAGYGGWEANAGAQPVEGTTSQDWSTGATVEETAVAAQVDPAPVQDTFAPVAEAPATDQYVQDTYAAEPAVAAPAGGEAVPAEVIGGDVTDAPVDAWATAPSEPEVVAPDHVEAAPEVGGGVTPEHQASFSSLVDRSRGRAAAGDRIKAVDAALADAVVSAAESQGFQEADRTAGDANHDLRFDGAPGESLGITLGRLKGDDVAGLRNGHVPITVRFQSAVYAGGLDAGVGDHGEVVIVSDEWSGQATSTVSLLLSLEDYLSDDLEVDGVAVIRDVGATVAVVRGRLV